MTARLLAALLVAGLVFTADPAGYASECPRGCAVPAEPRPLPVYTMTTRTYEGPT